MIVPNGGALALSSRKTAAPVVSTNVAVGQAIERGRTGAAGLRAASSQAIGRSKVVMSAE